MNKDDEARFGRRTALTWMFGHPLRTLGALAHTGYVPRTAPNVPTHKTTDASANKLGDPNARQ